MIRHEPSDLPSLWWRQNTPWECTGCAQNCLGGGERKVRGLDATAVIKDARVCLRKKAWTYFRVIRSVVLCSARSGMQRSSSSQPFQKGSWPKTKAFLGRRHWKFILWSDFHALSSLSPPSSLQWANCHPEPARGRSLGAPLVQRTRWAVHSLWSPDQNNTRVTQIVLI